MDDNKTTYIAAFSGFVAITVFYLKITIEYSKNSLIFPIRGHAPIMVIFQSFLLWFKWQYHVVLYTWGYNYYEDDSSHEIDIKSLKYWLNCIEKGIDWTILSLYLERIFCVWLFNKGGYNINYLEERRTVQQGRFDRSQSICNRIYLSLSKKIIKVRIKILENMDCCVSSFFIAGTALQVILTIFLGNLFWLYIPDDNHLFFYKFGIELIILLFCYIVTFWTPVDFQINREYQFLIIASIIKIGAFGYFNELNPYNFGFILSHRGPMLYWLIIYMVIVQYRVIHLTDYYMFFPPSLIQDRLDLLICNPVAFQIFEKYVRKLPESIEKQNANKVLDFIYKIEDTYQEDGKLSNQIMKINEQLDKDNFEPTIINSFGRLLIDDYHKKFLEKADQITRCEFVTKPLDQKFPILKDVPMNKSKNVTRSNSYMREKMDLMPSFNLQNSDSDFQDKSELDNSLALNKKAESDFLNIKQVGADNFRKNLPKTLSGFENMNQKKVQNLCNKPETVNSLKKKKLNMKLEITEVKSDQDSSFSNTDNGSSNKLSIFNAEPFDQKKNPNFKAEYIDQIKSDDKPEVQKTNNCNLKTPLLETNGANRGNLTQIDEESVNQKHTNVKTRDHANTPTNLNFLKNLSDLRDLMDCISTKSNCGSIKNNSIRNIISVSSTQETNDDVKEKKVKKPFKQTNGQKYYNNFLGIECKIELKENNDSFKMINTGKNYKNGAAFTWFSCYSYTHFVKKNKQTRIEIGDQNLLGTNIKNAFMTDNGIINIDDLDALCFHPDLGDNRMPQKDFKNRINAWNEKNNRLYPFYSTQIYENYLNDEEIVHISIYYYQVQKLDDVYQNFKKTKTFRNLQKRLKEFEELYLKLYSSAVKRKKRDERMTTKNQEEN